MCDSLREQLEYERERSREYFELLLTARQSVTVNQELSEPQQFQSVKPRFTTWRNRRRELELKHRKPETTPELTEAERLFEEELNGSKVS